MFNIFGRSKSREDKEQRRQRKRRRGDPTSTLERYVVEEVEVKAIPDHLASGPRKRVIREWTPALRIIGAYLGLWLMVTLAGFFSRSPWPSDETRTLAVAWEMWLARDWMLPRLNGAVEVTAPLFYWLTRLGWSIVGVQEWWPRVLPALGALATLVLTGRLARRLWPEETQVARYTPIILIGGFFFVLFTTVTITTYWSVFFVTMSLWALVVMWRARDMRAWLLLGLALGLGLLAGGPLILLYVLPPALLAPMWAKAPTRPQWRDWYVDLIKALVLGAAILAAWLVPASMKVGVEFAQEFMTTFVTPQLEGFIAAKAYWWWYLLLLPFVFFPWFIWPLPWIRFWRIRREPTDAGVAFCIAATVPAIVLLSLFAVKQPHYLLPIMPAAVLLITYLLLADALVSMDQDRAFAGMTLPLILIGCGLAVAPKLPRVDFLPERLWELPPWVGVALVGVGIALAFLPLQEIKRRVQNIVIISAVFAVFLLLGLGTQLDKFHRPDEAAQYLAGLEKAKRPIAVVGDYSGEFHFSGRLTKPFDVIGPEEIGKWLNWRPQGVLVSYSNAWQPRLVPMPAPLYETVLGDRSLRVWDGVAVAGAR